MNIKTQKPNFDNKDTTEKINALTAYIDNLKNEISVAIYALNKQTTLLLEEIKTLKGAS